MRTIRSKPSHYELPPISQKELNQMKLKGERVSNYAQDKLKRLGDTAIEIPLDIINY